VPREEALAVLCLLPLHLARKNARLELRRLARPTVFHAAWRHGFSGRGSKAATPHTSAPSLSRLRRARYRFVGVRALALSSAAQPGILLASGVPTTAEHVDLPRGEVAERSKAAVLEDVSGRAGIRRGFAWLGALADLPGASKSDPSESPVRRLDPASSRLILRDPGPRDPSSFWLRSRSPQKPLQNLASLIAQTRSAHVASHFAPPLLVAQRSGLVVTERTSRAKPALPKGPLPDRPAGSSHSPGS
jgi:hypothetical protein